MTEQVQHHTVRLFPSLEEERKFAATLSSKGVRRVELFFSGGGDSGSVEDISYFLVGQEGPYRAPRYRYPAQPDELGEGLVPCPEFIRRNCDSKFTAEGMAPLSSVVEALFDTAHPLTGQDWYNNDGGSGSFILTVNEDGSLTIECDMSIYYQASDEFRYSMAWALPDDDGVEE